ncbi:MAG: putative portal protein [Prokaryotic dsDNA virus sp.]|jgi:hypothetical protein|nr:MAG: putative portal protein [Prokaryotic dsDNA virus sp.]|tara:strand:- start:13219 stop:14739 length:1521 start_codon:yes stop_codon:yes gene_type:complete
MPAIRDRIIKGDETNILDYVLESHSVYQYYLNRWLFLNDAYTGGLDWYAGKNLEPYYKESREDYEMRLRMTGLDNHVRTVVGIYNSFLYRRPIHRELGEIETDPGYDAFLRDADLDGQSFDAFIKQVSTKAMVYGNVWVLLDKSDVDVATRADELNLGIRPYASMFTPENVLDWEYERQPNGLYELTFLKIKEEVVNKTQYIREYTKDTISVYRIDAKEKTAKLHKEYVNTLGKIPAVCVYASRSNTRGVGHSLISDIADLQKQIFEEYNECIQLIRISNHPSLVLQEGVEASAGAGSIVKLPSNQDPNLRPYLLQPNGGNIQAILDSIEKKVEAIDRMACLGGIRSIEARRLSAMALQVEFNLLSAKLSDIASQMEHAEEQIWKLYADFQGIQFNGDIEYTRNFSIQDKANDISMLKMAKDANIENAQIRKMIDEKIYETITDELMTKSEDTSDTPTDTLQHPPVTNQTQLVDHMREMINQNYTTEQIIQLHPELAQLFNNNTEE